MKFGDSPKVDVNVIPTVSIGLDMALGVGGIPRGRIIESGSGKNTRVYTGEDDLNINVIPACNYTLSFPHVVGGNP